MTKIVPYQVPMNTFKSIGNDIENNIDDDDVNDVSESSEVIDAMLSDLEAKKFGLDDENLFSDEPPQTNKKQEKKKPYLPPKEFADEYAKALVVGKPTPKLLFMFRKIAERYSTKFRCINKCDTEANINYAVCEAYMKWCTYDEKRSKNIFAYFTQMIKNDLFASHNELNRYKDHISIDSLQGGNEN